MDVTGPGMPSSTQDAFLQAMRTNGARATMCTGLWGERRLREREGRGLCS